MRLRLLLPLLSSTKPRSRERTGASFSKSWLAVFAFSALGSSSGCSESEGFGADDEIRESGNSVHLDPPPLVFPDPSGGSATGGGASGGAASGGSASGGAASGGSAAGGSSPLVADPPRSVSQYCGDRVHDAALEECDDGPENGLSGSVCSNDCQTRDVPLLAGSATDHRTVGFGRHPLSASHVVDFAARTSAGAAVWVEKSTPPAPASVHVEAMILDAYGNAVQPVTVTSGAHPTSFASPVVAGLGNGNYAVVWNDLNGDGSELGVALRKLVVNGASAYVEGTIFANSTTIGAQQDPDAIWTGSHLVVAWTDTSDPETAPDLRVRTFDANLGAASPETILANETVPETAVALAPHEGGWAAAFRRAQADGSESIVVVQGAHRVVVEPTSNPPEFFGPGGDEDRPALVSLDAQHLFVTFTVGTDPENTGVSNVPRLWGAVVDLGDDSVAWQGALAPLAAATVGDATRAQREPSAVVVGRAPNGSTVLPSGQNQVFVAWRSDAALGSALGEDLWLKRLDWNGATLTTNLPETALLRDGAEAPFVLENVEHGGGDQRVPQLAMLDVPGSPALGAKALGIVWEDWGSTFAATQASPDVALQLAPLPLRRGPPVDAGCATTACEEGEGPCASTSECASGLECAAEKGPWYGYGVSTSVCVVPHCGNWVPDADESGVDCGGDDCAECFSCLNPTTHEGTAHFCSAVCRCDNLEGDCDDDTDCSGHLECVEDTGNLVGHPGIDICVVPHCIDGEFNGGEDRLDCGGECPDCSLGTPNYCSTDVRCDEGQGGCETNGECSSGLTCVANQASHYGMPASAGVCLPSACSTRGGSFGTSSFCSTACRCPDGQGPCESDAECLGTLGGPAGKCRADRGLYYGQSNDTRVCIPDRCFNGVQDAGEIQVDCGGVCGTECPVCDGNRTFASFEYAANSGNAVGSRGWEYAATTGTITWSKSTSDKTDGNESLKFAGCGYSRVVSPAFSSSDFEVVGDVLRFDVKVGSASGAALPAGRYLGEYRLRLVLPNGERVELHELTFTGSGNAWQTVEVPISTAVRDIFLDATEYLRLELDLGLNCGLSDPPHVAFDHLRFAGNTTFRSLCRPAQGGPTGTDTMLDTLGFEYPALWSSPQWTVNEAPTKVQGDDALQVTSAYTELNSVSFPIQSLQSGPALLLDVRLPAPGSGQNLGGSVSVHLSCPTLGLTNRWIASRSIEVNGYRLPSGEWRTLPFAVPPDVQSALASGNGQCSFRITTQLTGYGSGTYVAYDHLRFAPATYCNTELQIDGVPFRVAPTWPNGEGSNPYRICTAKQLQTVVNTTALWSKHFLLEADLDLRTLTGQVGSAALPFSGSFNGQGHELSNYTVSNTAATDVGLFGRSSGTIDHLHLANFSVIGTTRVGALVGQNSGLVRNIVGRGVSVRLATNGTRAGGLIGENSASGILEDSGVTSSIDGLSGTWLAGGGVGFNAGTLRRLTGRGSVTLPGTTAGGLVGSSEGGLLQDLEASNEVSAGQGTAGGLIGRIDSGFATVVERSSAHGRVTGTGQVGGLIGAATRVGGTPGPGARIFGCHATGSVTATGIGSGGLAGAFRAGEIAYSHANGAVSGSDQTGGLVGLVQDGTIIRGSHALGNVTGARFVGGLVGALQSSSIRDSYARGATSASSMRAGGIVGETFASALLRVFGFGPVSSASSRGTVTGYQGGGTIFESALGNSTVNAGVDPVGNATNVPGTENLTTSQFSVLSNFTTRGWDTFFVWQTGTPTPELQPETCTQRTLSNTAPFVSGLPLAPNGTSSQPYPLCNAAQIDTLMSTNALLGSHFALLADVNLSGTSGTIGTATTPFTGTFDGRGRKLTNFSRVVAATDIGLFGVIQGDGAINGTADGVVKNLTLENFTISGTTRVGTLAGQTLLAAISNVHAVGGTATGAGGQLGGLVGLNTGTITNSSSSVTCVQNNGTDSGAFVGLNSGIISYSQATGSMTANWTTNGDSGILSIGGFVGQNGSNSNGPGIIEYCTASGSVVAEAEEVGGLVGNSMLDDSVIRWSSSSGLVDQNDGSAYYVGGLVGRLLEGDVLNSFSTSTVDSQYERVGGLVGYLADGALVEKCYATGTVKGDGRVGGLVGRTGGTTSTIRKSYATGSAEARVGNDAGGLVGYADTVTITDSYARGTATANASSAGALCGHARSSSISRTYASGAVDAASNEGRLIGSVPTTDPAVSLLASLGNSTTNSSVPTLIGSGTATSTTNSASVTSTQLNTQSTYTDRSWNFTTVWIMGTGGAVLR